jgi:hypothetical protein
VFQDKKGLHEFLTVEMQYYLPSLTYCNYEWLREIWAGKRKVSSYQELAPPTVSSM